MIALLSRKPNRFILAIAAALLLGALIVDFQKPAPASAQERSNFVGGLEENRQAAEAAPKAIRNDAAQPGEEIVTKRYWKIKKGSFPEFYQASEQGVWPFFEKIGARVIGMWLVVHPEQGGTEGSDDYDEVYLMTRYASAAHWKATRQMAAMGGNGPDWVKAREALDLRRSLTLETSLEFLQGHKWDNDPWFLPGLDEDYERVEP